MSKSIAIEPGLLELLQKVAWVRFFLDTVYVAQTFKNFYHIPLLKIFKMQNEPINEKISIETGEKRKSNMLSLYHLLATGDHSSDTMNFPDIQ